MLLYDSSVYLKPFDHGVIVDYYRVQSMLRVTKQRVTDNGGLVDVLDDLQMGFILTHGYSLDQVHTALQQKVIAVNLL